MSELCSICGKPIGIAKVSACLNCAIAIKKSVTLEWLEKEIKEEIEVLDLTEDYQRGQADALNELFYQARKHCGEAK